MDKREHNFRLCFDPEYAKRHEFTQEWVKKHTKTLQQEVTDDVGPVAMGAGFAFLVTRNLIAFFATMVLYLLFCFIYWSGLRRRSRRIAELVWRDFHARLK
jgi:hypothetical protein